MLEEEQRWPNPGGRPQNSSYLQSRSQVMDRDTDRRYEELLPVLLPSQYLPLQPTYHGYNHGRNVSYDDVYDDPLSSNAHDIADDGGTNDPPRQFPTAKGEKQTKRSWTNRVSHAHRSEEHEHLNHEP